MDVSDDMPNKPTLFAVQSTHKMLAASPWPRLVHVKLSRARRSSSTSSTKHFMMHGTTSPFYPLIASLGCSRGHDGRACRADADDGNGLRRHPLSQGDVVDCAPAAPLEDGDGWFFRLFNRTASKDPLDGTR